MLEFQKLPPLLLVLPEQRHDRLIGTLLRQTLNRDVSPGLSPGLSPAPDPGGDGVTAALYPVRPLPLPQLLLQQELLLLLLLRVLRVLRRGRGAGEQRVRGGAEKVAVLCRAVDQRVRWALRVWHVKAML